MFRFLYLMLILCSLLTVGCSGDKPQDKPVQPQQSPVKQIVLYSELDSKFTEDLLRVYNEHIQKNKKNIAFSAIYELKEEAKTDLVLAEQRTLNGLKIDRKLAPAAFEMGDRLPDKFRDGEMLWHGVFYDPVVFLINQQYSRSIGQQSLRGWSNLEDATKIRIAIENLSDSNSTQNFLGSMADAYGETTSLNYLWNINRFIAQYAKFPFTPIRMTAVGDADLAITRQSYVYKYLENKFPAYVLFPQEGTPVNLYGVGIFKDCTEQTEAIAFTEWLMTSAEAKQVSEKDATGYMFLFPNGQDGALVDADKLWLNKNYLARAQQDALVNRWLERVRFSR